jgi:hypothetical protein
MKLFLFWLPRLLALTLAFSLGIFAIDVLSMPAPFWRKIGGFIIHLIPSISILAITTISWKKSFIGILLFAILFVGFTLFFKTYNNSTRFIILSLPILIIALLYSLDFLNSRREEGKNEQLKAF